MFYTSDNNNKMAIEELYTSDMAEWYDKFYCTPTELHDHLKFLKRIFNKHKVKSILDVGCGTGRHSIALHKAGFTVQGIDLEVGMIDYAKKTSKEQNLQIPFEVQDMRKINVNKKFDAVIVLYTTFSYLRSNDDIIKTLQSIRKHLKPNGIIIIDTFFVWPHLAKGTFKTEVRDKEIIGNKTFEQIDSNKLDLISNRLFVTATFKRKIGNKSLPTVKDKKAVELRLFLPNELDLFYRLTGFKQLEIYGDFKNHKLSNEHHRRLISVAQRI